MNSVLQAYSQYIRCNRVQFKSTGPDGAVVMSSANGLVGTGFVSQYRLQPRAGF